MTEEQANIMIYHLQEIESNIIASNAVISANNSILGNSQTYIILIFFVLSVAGGIYIGKSLFTKG